MFHYSAANIPSQREEKIPIIAHSRHEFALRTALHCAPGYLTQIPLVRTAILHKNPKSSFSIPVLTSSDPRDTHDGVG